MHRRQSCFTLMLFLVLFAVRGYTVDIKKQISMVINVWFVPSQRTQFFIHDGENFWHLHEPFYKYGDIEVESENSRGHKQHSNFLAVALQ